MFSGKFDQQGETVVIQERYHGPEVSAFALSDGTNFLMIPIFAQDHKRLLAGDKGPNTGGMGVYAPLPPHLLSDNQIDELSTIAAKTFKAMARQGTPYQGVLYIGAMLADETSGSPIMIEYNARFGDPEAEVILPLLTRSGVDMFDLLLAVANQDISSISLPSSIA
jgi:phosphoribosylamine--glycine ligase